ncbi:hypothetical protein [Amycolatopsis nalaikhensis]|uniref:Transposase IS111A/IS1328/IS1533 N-terminal domain-containing protein n=1 Tax=Amycolatopsis nalaikhensis TaxID=715472 RepID=A0ABY8XYU7_9PSEU|nr:hypothetical protein [Amycolatopsis sp. 2-2]WIV60915.1 hypothetical protein QP939_21070 [Amycolatopsis sp. 2-2]
MQSQDIEEDVMPHGSGLSRGDKRRNERLARLRALVPPQNAIVGIDLADEKQAIVVTDHDSRVLARKRVRAKAWRLGSVLEWAREVARRHGFADVTVGCGSRPIEWCNSVRVRLCWSDHAVMSSGVASSSGVGGVVKVAMVASER